MQKLEMALKWTTVMPAASPPPGFQAAIEKRTAVIQLSRAPVFTFCWPLSRLKLETTLFLL